LDPVSDERHTLRREEKAPTPLAVGKFKYDLDGPIFGTIEAVLDTVGGY